MRANLKEKIRNLLETIDSLIPYAIVGGGLAATQYPEAFKAVEAILLAYILAKGAMKSLKKKNPRVAKLAEKIAEDTEKALEKMGLSKEELEKVEKYATS